MLQKVFPKAMGTLPTDPTTAATGGVFGEPGGQNAGKVSVHCKELPLVIEKSFAIELEILLPLTGTET